MTTADKSEKTEITISNNSEQKLVTHSSEESYQKKATSAASSQMQLLALAKKFDVDGAFIAAEKKMPLEDRGRKRERKDLLRKQQNLEAIIQRAVEYCSDQQVAERTDQDWFTRFIDLCENISNKTMQDLWAKILAGEISSPGSFSLKSLKAFRTMSIFEAKLLAKACAVSMKDNSRKNIRIISGGYQTPGLFNFFSKNRDHKINLNQFGLSYAELLTLADNHLIFIQETETNLFDKGEALHFNFNGSNIQLSAVKNNVVLSFYKFTPIGAELAQLISDNPEQSFLHTLKTKLGTLFNITESNEKQL